MARLPEADTHQLSYKHIRRGLSVLCSLLILLLYYLPLHDMNRGARPRLGASWQDSLEIPSRENFLLFSKSLDLSLGRCVFLVVNHLDGNAGFL